MFSQPPNRASKPTHTIEISKLLKQFESIKHKHNVSSTLEPNPQENPSRSHKSQPHPTTTNNLPISLVKEQL